VRIYAALEGDIDASADAIATVDALGERYLDDPLLKTGAIAFDVTDDPARRESLERAASEVDARGWQLILRTSNERALEIALDVVERTSRASDSDRERRHRIEHTGHVSRALVVRAAELGIIMSIQPPALPTGLAARIPPSETAEDVPSTAALYRAIVEAGGRFVLGSDWPYLPLDPLRGLHGALDAPEGSAPLQPGDAIAAYTRDAAWASFDEHRKGVLARDMLADLVIFTEDVFALPASRLSQAEVACTIFDGRVVYRRDVSETN
jgi:predicted amidohydrolase YtcJ